MACTARQVQLFQNEHYHYRYSSKLKMVEIIQWWPTNAFIDCRGIHRSANNSWLLYLHRIIFAIPFYAILTVTHWQCSQFKILIFVFGQFMSGWRNLPTDSRSCLLQSMRWSAIWFEYIRPYWIIYKIGKETHGEVGTKSSQNKRKTTNKKV